MASNTAPSSPDEYTLVTYFRSSCSARLRIALNLKSLPYTSEYVNLLKDEHLSAAHQARNPSKSVPVLYPPSTSGTGKASTGFSIGQSLAALEYLEEAHPERRSLLPRAGDLAGRATVRALANIIACDLQPVTNMRILRRVGALGGEREAWARELMGDGLRAYEAVAESTAGVYSYGDELTMADVCLVPAVWGAQRYGVDLTEFPTLMRVFETLSKDEAVIKAHWKRQGDTPEELRA